MCPVPNGWMIIGVELCLFFKYQSQLAMKGSCCSRCHSCWRLGAEMDPARCFIWAACLARLSLFISAAEFFSELSTYLCFPSPSAWLISSPTATVVGLRVLPIHVKSHLFLLLPHEMLPLLSRTSLVPWRTRPWRFQCCLWLSSGHHVWLSFI